jgi:hypothetical protein
MEIVIHTIIPTPPIPRVIHRTAEGGPEPDVLLLVPVIEVLVLVEGFDVVLVPEVEGIARASERN